MTIPPRRSWSWVLRDGAALAALSIVGYVLGVMCVSDFIAAGNRPQLYQSEFAPAAAAACGLGYRNLPYEPDSPLSAFLDGRADRVACNQLPRPAPLRLDSFQGISRYLELTVAAVWHIRGLAWSALLPLYGAVYAITAALLYGLFRLAAGPAVASAWTLLVILSPLHLQNLPNLRDFAKAPFVLGLLLIMAWLMRQRWPERRVAALCAAGGVVAGVGLGFRNDLLLLWPIVALLTIAAPAPPGRRIVRAAGRAGLFAAACVMTAWPILGAYQKGSNTGHVVLLGMTTGFDTPLGIERPVYDVGRLYNDDYMYVTVRSVAERLWSGTGAMEIGSAPYDAACIRYISILLRQFPADVLVRSYAAGLAVVRAPFGAATDPVPWLRPWLRTALRLRGLVVRQLRWPAIIALLLTVWFLLSASPWQGIAAIVVLGVLGTGAGIQFHPRHFFYLEFALLWPLAACLDPLVGSSRSAQLRRLRSSIAFPRMAAAGLIGVLLILIAGAIGARMYQQARVRRLLVRVHELPAEKVQPTTEFTSGTVRYRVGAVAAASLKPPTLEHPVMTGYYAVDFGGAACDVPAFDATFKYQSDVPFDDFTEQRHISLPPGVPEVSVYYAGYDAWFPYYEPGDVQMRFHRARFDAIELPSGAADCFLGVRRVRDDASPDVLLNVMFSPGWERTPLYQRLVWEPQRQPEAPAILTVGPGPVSRHSVERALQDRPTTRIAMLASSARALDDGIHVSGDAEGPFSYVITSQPVRLPRDALAVVRGRLDAGGITVGLLQDGAWAGNVNVLTQGRFVVVLQPPSEGVFQIVVANCLLGGSRTNRFNIEAIGWLGQQP